MLLKWVFAFFVLALIAAIFGFTNIAGAFAWVGKVLFVLFLILFILWLLAPRARPK